MTADGVYKASIAATEGESENCFMMHDRELDQIADKLAELRPDSLHAALQLLRFVVSQTKDCDIRNDALELKIIRNVTEALPDINRKQWERVRDETKARIFEEALFDINSLFNIIERARERKRLDC